MTDKKEKDLEEKKPAQSSLEALKSLEEKEDGGVVPLQDIIALQSSSGKFHWDPILESCLGGRETAEEAPGTPFAS